MTTPGESHRRVSEVELRVRYAETDQMKVVYHANYLVWCEVGRTDFIRRLGKPYGDIEKQGVSLAVVDAAIRYHAPARYEDLILVRTTLAAVRSRSITFSYVITNATSGLKLVTATTVLASINGEGNLVSMPVDLRRSLESSIA